MKRTAYRSVIAAMAMTCAVVLPAYGQNSGTIEISGFGAAGQLREPVDRAVCPNCNLGGGGRLALFATRWLSLEVEGSKLVMTDGVARIPARAGLLLHVVGRHASLFLGGQYLRGTTSEQNGASGRLGLRLRLSNAIGIRVEGLVDLYPAVADQPQQLEFGAQFGLSLQFGGSAKEPSFRDSDDDGVADRLDACAYTPPTSRVDKRGCPGDRDRDGVADNLDQCPATRRFVEVKSNGCRRADEPKRVVRVVRPKEKEADVFDADDDIEDLIDDDDEDEDDDEDDDDDDDDDDEDDDDEDDDDDDDDDLELRAPLVLEGVTFASGTADLTQPAKAILMIVAQSLRNHPDVKIEVAGHSDNRGRAARNRRLSHRRAEAVMDLLIKNGIPRRQLRARGYGSSEPIAWNKTRRGRRKNRRVELRRLSH